MQTLRVFRTKVKHFLLIAATLMTASCTSTPTDPHDPLEPFNREVFKFNMTVDKAVFRPVAKAYDTVTPAPVQRSVGNFFGNLGELDVVANDLLQANIPLAFQDAFRFVINTTMGVLGLFDPATDMGYIKHRQDFGLTLARWGYTDSRYFVIPFLGASTVRDTFGVPVDYYALSVYRFIDDDYTRYSLVSLYYINKRAALLSTDKLLYEAFDPYAFMRSAYLQSRQQQIDTLRKTGRVKLQDSSPAYSSHIGNKANTTISN